MTTTAKPKRDDARARAGYEPDAWRGADGAALDCDEKLAVLRENLGEIDDVVREALEDAVLMGVDERQFRDTLKRLVDGLASPYQKKT